MMDYDHEDIHHDEMPHDEPKAEVKEEEKAVKTDNWANYYDFIINEGSFKFWAAFQVSFDRLKKIKSNSSNFHSLVPLSC